jgi:hypothetical protein
MSNLGIAVLAVGLIAALLAVFVYPILERCGIFPAASGEFDPQAGSKPLRYVKSSFTEAVVVDVPKTSSRGSVRLHRFGESEVVAGRQFGRARRTKRGHLFVASSTSVLHEFFAPDTDVNGTFQAFLIERDDQESVEVFSQELTSLLRGAKPSLRGRMTLRHAAPESGNRLLTVESLAADYQRES